MRNLITISLSLMIAGFLIFAGIPCYAQDQAPEQEQTQDLPESVQKAEEFFNRCVADPIIDLSDSTDEAFCACAATNMQQWIEKNSQSIGSDFLGNAISTSKELDSNTTLTEIYASCLHIPVYEMSYLDCYYEPRNAHFSKGEDTLKALCHCLAQGDSTYFEQFAKPFIEMRIAKGKDISDPIKDIKYDVNFSLARQNTDKQCYNEYIYNQDGN